MRNSLFQLEMFCSDLHASSARFEELCLLPGVPQQQVLSRYAQAPGNELSSGKFFHPESSAALVANAFGYFLDKHQDLPPLPSSDAWWSEPELVDIETSIELPWLGGRHPCLDAFVLTRTALFGVESKRYEPYRVRHGSTFSPTYWRNVWGSKMQGYQLIRDKIAAGSTPFKHLDAVQLVKHALALRTLASHHFLLQRKPILIYLHAEPKRWPNGMTIKACEHERHFRELHMFSSYVSNDEVSFVHFSYEALLATWAYSPTLRTRDHARRVRSRFFYDETTFSEACDMPAGIGEV